MASKWDDRLIDVAAAWYASQGDSKCYALNDMKFGEVIDIISKVPDLYPDLVMRSRKMRELRGGICHMSCHVMYMLKEESKDDHANREKGPGTNSGNHDCTGRAV